MQKILRTAMIAVASLLLLENSSAQNFKLSNSTASVDPVFPSIAATPANPVFNANDVSYLNGDSAVAVGSNGMAWMSTDGGLTWNTILTFTSSANNNAVYWEDNYICVAGDAGTVTFSMDYGLTWQSAPQAIPSINYHGVDFANTTFGVSVGDAGEALVYRWSGNFHWVHSPVGINRKLNAVSAFKTSQSPFTEGNAITVGDKGLVATYASGGWSVLPNAVTTNLKGVYLFDDHVTALAVGDSGLIMRSPDLGNTWTILHYGTNEALNDISEGTNPNEIIAVGDSGVIYFSSDAGYTFTRYSVGFNTTNLKGVSSKNPRGSFAGSGSTLRTFANDTASITSLNKTVFCPGSSFKAAISLKGIYGPLNLVSIQLSDANGSFATPLIIGSKLNPLLLHDSIVGTIPLSITPSALYKIRIHTSDPEILSDPHPNTLLIYAEPEDRSIQISSTNLYVRSQSGCTYQWYYNSISLPGAADTIVTTNGNGTYLVQITNANGCSISSNPFNYYSTPQSVISTTSQIVIGPNPLSNNLYVKVPENSSAKILCIHDALGNHVYSSEVRAGANNYMISDIEPGIYFITVDNCTRKIIVCR